MKVYHNPRCGKSREAVNLLEKKKVKHEIYLYLKEGLTQKEIKDLLKKLKMDPIDLIRTNEKDYKENFAGKKMTDAALIKAMVKYPKLLQRPIVVKGRKAIVARPAELLKDFLK